MRLTITQKVGLVLLLFAGGAVLALGVFYSFLINTSADEAFINVAGRQRMLSERLHAYANRVRAGRDEDRTELRELVNEFDHALFVLEHGGTAMERALPHAPPEIADEIAAVKRLWRKNRRTLLLIAGMSGKDPEAQQMYEGTHADFQQLTKASNQVVSAYEARSQTLRRRMLNILAAIAVFDLALFFGGLRITRDYVRDRKRIEGDLRRQSQIIDQIHDAVVSTDLEDHITSWNKGAERLFGYPADEMYGKHISVVYPEDEHATLQDQVIAPLKKKDNHEVVVRMRKKSGEDFYAHMSLSRTHDERGTVTGMIGYALNITRRRNAEAALRDSEERLRNLVETTNDWIWEVDQDARYTYVSPQCRDLLGYAPEEILGKTPFDLMPPEEAERVANIFGPIVAAREPFTSLENTNRRKDGNLIVLETSGVPFFGAKGNFRGYRGIDRDITARKRIEERLQQMAHYDSLTGLPNRSLFIDHLNQALARAHRHQQRVAILFLDLDRFKNINDTLGHDVGDELLRAVSERLTKCVREDDTVARLGGDEFVLILTEISHEFDAVKVAEKVIRALAKPFVLGQRELFVTTSIGISLYPDDGEDAQSLIKNADIAMYRTKEQGRNNYQLYTPAMNTMALERLTLENDLRQALKREEFLIHYQPKVDLHTGQMAGMEALLRWQHPEHGLVAPEDFIPLLHETNLIVSVCEWALHTVCRQNKAWQKAGFPPMRVAVNLCARQFMYQDLTELVAGVLLESGLEPRWLELEIAESVLMEYKDAAAATLRKLNETGVHLTIDDFGTGYSSLSYLKRFPIDTLKIDGPFVHDITVDPDDAAITEAVIAMAHSMKMRVVAEGVETKEQLAFLCARQCDEMQGNYYSEALTVEGFTQFLLENHRLEPAEISSQQPSIKIAE